MTFSAFLTVKNLKDNSPILSYVNEDELQVYIRPAQDIYIQRGLGTKMYYNLMSKVATQTLIPIEVELITQYIQPALVWWATHEFALYANYKFTNKSISKQNSDNSTPSDLSEVNYVTTNIRNKAEYFSERLTKHLMGSIAVFPDYIQVYDNLYENVPSTRDNFFWGIYTGGSGCGFGCGEIGPNPGNSRLL